MISDSSKRKLKRSVSILSAVALVLPTALPISAKTSKITKIQSMKPLSDIGKTVKTTLTLKKGKSFKIKTKYAGKKLMYKSSKKKVAVVSKSGKIKAKRVGKARITVSPKGNKKVKVIITVTVVKSLKKVKKIKLNSRQLSLNVGRTGQLKATVVSPKKPTTKKLNWFSSDKKIAVVNKKGLVTAKGAGTAKITVAAADGQGAKAVCKVTVTAAGAGVQSPNPGVSTASPTATNGGGTTGKPDTKVTVQLAVPGDRTGVKQGETLQLSAKDAGTGKEITDVQWSVSEVTGVSISKTGALTIAKDAPAGETVKVTVKNTSSSDSKDLTIVEDKVTELPENMLQINKSTDAAPFGLTYRTGSKGEKAFSTVSDPERGEVLKFDASVGYTGSSNDMLAWMDIDRMYSAKTVTISAYMKYDKVPDVEKMNLVINENWNHKNPAVKYNAEPDKWYYVTGTYTFPDADEPDFGPLYYDGTHNRLYICRDVNLPKNVNAVYYLDDLTFTVEKAKIDGVDLSIEGDATEIYQNHELQCSAVVKGEGKPIQQVTYSIDPAVTGATISESGLLTVKNAKAGSKITIKATSKEDTSKFATKTITVLAQTIDSIKVSAEGSPKNIYQNNKLAFTAEVASTGDPDDSVEWSISPAVEGAAISKEGVLDVGKVKGGTVLHVKATSKFDETKSDTYDITVLENKVNSVTVKSAGDKTTIAPGEQMSLSAELDVTGTPSENVTWELTNPISGVSLANKTGSNNTLIVDKSVADGTSISVRATSEFDTTKYGELTVTVESASQSEFNLNKLSVEKWEDFNGDTIGKKTIVAAAEAVGVTFQTTVDEAQWYSVSNKYKSEAGVLEFGNTVQTKCMRYIYGAKDDYIQFQLENTGSEEKTYNLSFMFSFAAIADESTTDNVAYKLPLKMIALDENNTETELQSGIKLPYRCCSSDPDLFNGMFDEISASVKIDAGKTVRLRLKLDGDLPACISGNSLHEGVAHPVECRIDNIAISSGAEATLSMKTGDTYQLNLDTLDTDRVSYYTNCYLTKYTHDENKPNIVGYESCQKDHGFGQLTATVDENGLVTAGKAGDTTLIAVITHGDGTVDRKQCFVHVE